METRKQIKVANESRLNEYRAALAKLEAKCKEEGVSPKPLINSEKLIHFRSLDSYGEELKTLASIYNCLLALEKHLYNVNERKIKLSFGSRSTSTCESLHFLYLTNLRECTGVYGIIYTDVAGRTIFLQFDKDGVGITEDSFRNNPEAFALFLEKVKQGFYPFVILNHSKYSVYNSMRKLGIDVDKEDE